MWLDQSSGVGRMDLKGEKMSDIRKEVEVRYHIRFNNPYDNTVMVSKDGLMALDKAKELWESGRSFNRKVYVVEVREKLLRSLE